MILIFTLIVCIGVLTSCRNGEEIRSSTLLDNVVSDTNKKYQFEKIPWLSTKEEVLKQKGLNDKDVEVLKGDNESLKLKNDISFKNPKTKATVIYKFQDNKFCGGEYIISVEKEEELVSICNELKTLLSKQFETPFSNTLEELSKKSIENKNSSSVQWLGEDKSDFNISIPITNSNHIICISVNVPIEKTQLH